MAEHETVLEAENYYLILKIIKRAGSELGLETSQEKLNLHMDLELTDAILPKGMDFLSLLTARSFDFAHDIYKIQDHLNRKTKTLERGFLPRFINQ